MLSTFTRVSMDASKLCSARTCSLVSLADTQRRAAATTPPASAARVTWRRTNQSSSSKQINLVNTQRGRRVHIYISIDLKNITSIYIYIRTYFHMSLSLSTYIYIYIYICVHIYTYRYAPPRQPHLPLPRELREDARTSPLLRSKKT